MMNINTVSVTDINKAMKSNHRNYDKAGIKAAAEYMEEKHQGVLRVSGEPYSQHPLRVALKVAEMGFESPVVIAAILHDVVEDTDTDIKEIEGRFGKPVAEMVDAVTKVKIALDKHEKMPKTERNRLSDIKMLHKMDDKSLFIKVADRIDNLETIEVMPEEKQLKKAEHTRTIIIPALIQEGAFKLVDVLESLCFKIEHRAQYDQIADTVAKVTRTNSQAAKRTIELFNKSLTSSSDSIPASLMNYKDYIVDFSCNQRSCISFFRQISKEADNLDRDFSKILCKKNMPFYDFTLIIDEDINDNIADFSPTDIFFEFYKEIFIEKGIVISDIRTTTYGDSDYLLLTDEMQNKYRLFIKTQSEYMMYCLGDAMKEINEYPWNNVDEIAPEYGTFKKKIKVFMRNGDSMLIDEDATVLDFAFAIHTEIGLHLESATVNGNKVQPHQRLNYGDKVVVYQSPKIEPQISWFKIAHTSRAVEALISYFESRQKNIETL